MPMIFWLTYVTYIVNGHDKIVNHYESGRLYHMIQLYNMALVLLIWQLAYLTSRLYALTFLYVVRALKSAGSPLRIHSGGSLAQIA